MVTVTKTADNDALQSYTFTQNVAGPIWVRVRDLNRTPGRDRTDTVSVDAMYVMSSLSTGYSGEAARVSAALADGMLSVAKSGDGLQSLRWWREGRVDRIEAYCRDDVRLLRDLFEHACEHGQLLFRTKGGERVRLPLRLSLPELVERAQQGARGAAPPRPDAFLREQGSLRAE